MSGESLGGLLRLIWLPYQLLKSTSEESRLGTSEMDREVGRFWKAFSVIATFVVIVGAVVWIRISQF